jgi:hypothetical protein
MAADDIASALAEAAVGEPLNGMMELGGPETFTLDEAVRKVLQFDHDQRHVVADSRAPYYGVQVSERTLVPEPGAHLGSTKLDWWITHVAPPPKVAAAVAPSPMPAH